MRVPKVKEESATAKKNREHAEKVAKISLLAKTVKKGALVYTRLGTIFKLLNVEVDPAARWDSESRGTYVARLVNGRNIKIPGRGKNEEEAIVNAILHLETMGYTVLYSKEEIETFTSNPMPEKKKKKGIPFQ